MHRIDQGGATARRRRAASTALATALAVAIGSLATVAHARDDEAAAQARAAIARHGAELHATAAEQHEVHGTTQDASGARHVRFTRRYRGLRVRGGDFVVHLDGAGRYAHASSGLTAPITLSTTPGISAGAAAARARTRFAGTIESVDGGELVVDATGGRGRLAWEHRIVGWGPDGEIPSRLHVLTDAHTGAHIASWDEIIRVVGTGRSLYSGTVAIDAAYNDGYSLPYAMMDGSHGGNTVCDMQNGTSLCMLFEDADNVWGDGTTSDRQSAAVDAAYGAAVTFDYFKKVHGRSGVLGDGNGVPSRVHYGKYCRDAFWDGSQMTFCDAERWGRRSSPLTSLEIVAHEMTHGISDATANFMHTGEPGALAEATSDIFGAMVEFFADNPSDPPGYLVGEQVHAAGGATPMRYMYDPALDGESHGCWSSTTKDAEIHASSGVASHFFFMLAEGSGNTSFGFSPTCGSAPAVAGIGRSAAERIWFRALSTYFTSSTSYVDTANPSNTARAHTLQAATDLFGRCGRQYRAVQAAWTAVNVAGPDEVCPPILPETLTVILGALLD